MTEKSKLLESHFIPKDKNAKGYTCLLGLLNRLKIDYDAFTEMLLGTFETECFEKMIKTSQEQLLSSINFKIPDAYYKHVLLNFIINAEIPVLTAEHISDAFEKPDNQNNNATNPLDDMPDIKC